VLTQTNSQATNYFLIPNFFLLPSFSSRKENLLLLTLPQCICSKKSIRVCHTVPVHPVQYNGQRHWPSWKTLPGFKTNNVINGLSSKRNAVEYAWVQQPSVWRGCSFTCRQGSCSARQVAHFMTDDTQLIYILH
jgi:hypothetical protein